METIVNENSEVVTSQAADLDSASPTPISVVHVSIPNQPVQVQSVIQPAPSSVIQATGQLQTIQVTTVGSDGDGDDDLEGKKRREILARRPSYRRILNELSSDAPTTITVSKIEEESTNGSQTSQESQEGNEAATNLTSHALTSVAGTVQYQQSTGETVTVVPAGAIQIAAHGDGTTQGLQTLTMTNVNAANTQPSAATIVQYAQGPDGQLFIPSLAGLAGNVQTYQIQTTPTTLPQGVVMATTGSALASPQQLSEEAARKRELRLLKNRDAAKECRRKKKEYVKCLENRVAVLENQNKALIEELKSLKELYCQKEAVGQ